ncbi:hypothetical protein NLM27_26275 [Bradyrhizobium sp. CCGB12]|nr:hypothetical protein [Bradyrhizobium sp. CCGB12]MCP3392268.1 hypothetical protein [Bradyrhizobium sp. CCGB12]
MELEVVIGLVNLLRQRAFQEQIFELRELSDMHAIADKPLTGADEDRHLADLLANGKCGSEHVWRSLRAAHDFQQPHDVGWGKEMHVNEVDSATGYSRNLVDVQEGRIGG